ncbi:hypothetical protein PL874_05140, partial [Bifidobacterium animalis]|nr:hypothetical protein [Bifidobacterium animalis]
AGYQPEIAYFEVCHELKMIVDLMNEIDHIHCRRQLFTAAANDTSADTRSHNRRRRTRSGPQWGRAAIS